LNALKRDGKKIAAAIIITRGTTAESIFFTDTMTRNALIRRFDAACYSLILKTEESRTKHNQTQNQELARDRLGESRRMAPFSRAQKLCRPPRRWLAGGGCRSE
jgi:hypothetical protein